MTPLAADAAVAGGIVERYYGRRCLTTVIVDFAGSKQVVVRHRTNFLLDPLVVGHHLHRLRVPSATTPAAAPKSPRVSNRTSAHNTEKKKKMGLRSWTGVGTPSKPLANTAFEQMGSWTNPTTPENPP